MKKATPEVTLSSYGMPDDYSTEDFAAWVRYVAEHIEEACGFAVIVDSFGFGEPVFRDEVITDCPCEERTIREAIQALWER